MLAVATNKSQLANLLQSPGARLDFVSPKNSRSPLWCRFRQVVVNGVVQPFARCDLCKAFISYRCSTGTGSLLRHSCKSIPFSTELLDSPGPSTSSSRDYFLPVSTASSNQGASTSQNPIFGSPPAGVGVVDSMKFSSLVNCILKTEPADELQQSSAVPEETKRLVGERAAGFLVKNLLPVECIEDDSFVSLAQLLLDLGAEFGPQLAPYLLQEEPMHRVYIDRMFHQLERQVKEILKECEFLAFSLNRIEQDSRVISVNLHFIDHHFRLKRVFLSTAELPDSEIDIISHVTRNLSKFVDDPAWVWEKMKSAIFVSNCPSALTLASSVGAVASTVGAIGATVGTVDCAACLLNDVMNDMIGTLCLSEEIRGFLGSVAAYIDRESSPTDGAAAKTWRAVYCDLKMARDIKREHENSNPDPEFERTLSQIVNFLELFEHCYECLGGKSNSTTMDEQNVRPNLNEFVLWRMKLERRCVLDPDDNHVTVSLKNVALNSLTSRMKFHAFHKIALFLDPNFKNLKLFDESERTSTMSHASSMLKEIRAASSSSAIAGSLLVEGRRADDPIELEPRPKIAKTLNQFREFLESSSDSDEDEKDDRELRRYREKRVSSGSVEDVLGFWLQNAEFSNLRVLSRRILSLPVSSCSSDVASTRLEHQACLGGDELRKMLFINKNLELL